MRPTLKHLVVLVMVAAGGLAQAQDRLPRVLDPLGILPTPRQVLHTLDHVARVLPPVVVETGPAYGYDDGCAYPVHPVRGYYPRRVYFAPPPYGRPYPRPYRVEYRGHGYGHDRDHGVHRGR